MKIHTIILLGLLLLGFPSGFIFWKKSQDSELAGPGRPPLETFEIHRRDDNLMVLFNRSLTKYPPNTWYSVHFVNETGKENIDIGNITNLGSRIDYNIKNKSGRYNLEFRSCNNAGCSEPTMSKIFEVIYESVLAVPDKPPLHYFLILSHDGDVLVHFNQSISFVPNVWYSVHLVNIQGNNGNIDIGNITNSRRRIDYNIKNKPGRYNLELRSCNNAGCSEPTMSKIFEVIYETELPKAISGYLRVENVTNETCTIEWNKIQTEADLLKYNVHLYKGNRLEKNYTLIYPSFVNSDRFVHLQPGTSYVIRLYTVNSKNISKNFISTTFMTKS